MEQNNNNRKRKKHKHIKWEDRIVIEKMVKAECENEEIARIIECSERTIEREIKRGTWIKKDYMWRDVEVYNADFAQRKHDEKGKNKGPQAKISEAPILREYLEHKIKDEHYSPEAALMSAKNTGFKFEVDLCPKSVYNNIDSGEIDVKRAELPRKRSWKKKQQKEYKYEKAKRGRSIDERPNEANARAEKGHWEGDLVVGKRKSKHCLLTLTDRKTRREIIRRIPNKTQESVIKALEKIKFRQEDLGFKTITFDNGSEFLNFEAIEKAMKCEVYYAHPYSSWERGTNENANGLIRRFFPKGTDFGRITLGELRRVEAWINKYPRKIHGGLSALQYEQNLGA